MSAIVYVLDGAAGTKVGMTCRSVDERVRDIGRASGCEPTVVFVVENLSPGKARQIEAVAHWLLRDTRTLGEWFHCHPLQAVDAVRKASNGATYLEYLRWVDQERGLRRIAA